MKYHGILAYQFYMVAGILTERQALIHIDEGTVPDFMHGNSNQEHSSIKTDMCIAWLGRICSELAEGLPIGFRLELAKRVLLKSYFEI
jgi:hypothetical protein